MRLATRKFTTATLIASISASSTLMVGCETQFGQAVEETWDEMGNVGKTAVIGIGTFFGAWALGMDPEDAAILAGVVAGITFVTLTVMDQYEATEEDEQVMEQEYENRRETMTNAERTVIANEGAKLAVKVGETETSILVMIVDAETGESVDGQVYEIAKSEVENLETLEDVQDTLEEREDVTEEQEEALSTETVEEVAGPTPTPPNNGQDTNTPPRHGYGPTGIASGSDDTPDVGPGPTEQPDPVDNPPVVDSGDNTSPTPGPNANPNPQNQPQVNAEDIRFGRIGSENVIFRL